MFKNKYNILIVEDNKVITNLLIKHLIVSQYTVNSVGSITGARRLLNKRFFDLIVLDVQLPDGSGLDLLSDIRNNYKLENIKIIILTQNTSIDNRLLSFKAGADDYVPKPFYPMELIARINRLLGINKKNKHEVIYKNLKLNKHSYNLEYNKQNLNLTKTEKLFIEFLITFPTASNNERMLLFMNTKLNKNITNRSLNVTATRLRKKINSKFHIEIYKSKYGKGYYLNI